MSSGKVVSAETLLKIWEEADKSYPPGIHPVDTTRFELEGLGFFPAGVGRYAAPGRSACHDLALGGLFVLGNNFGSRGYLDRLLGMELPSECEQGDTWGPLLSQLREAKVALDSCFFSNSYLGYLAGSSNMAAFPTLGSFTSQCAKFLKMELEQLRPRVVIALGAPARKLLAHKEVNLDLMTWQKNSLEVLDRRNQAFREVNFAGVTFTVIAWVHPSAQDRKPKKDSLSYLESRYYIRDGTQHVGRAAEVEMLRNALR